ncbi:sporulation transcription factor [Trichoderma reesei QM6a]|uniref:Bromodomain-containing protein n=2 Tax=Hypocrea jecorina TaxID=51453 RepID=A0A024RUR0_HYPJR
MASPTADQPPVADKDKMAEANGHAPAVSESAESAKPDAEKENKAPSDKADEALVNGKPSPAASADTPNGVSTTNGQGDKDKEQDKEQDKEKAQENDKEKAQEVEKKDTPAADAPVAADSESVQEKPQEKPVESAKDEEKKPAEEAAAEKKAEEKKAEAETTAQEKPDVEMTDAESADDAKASADTAATPTTAKESAPKESTEAKAEEKSEEKTEEAKPSPKDTQTDVDADADADTVMTDDKPAVKPEEEAAKPKPKVEEAAATAPSSNEVDLGSPSMSKLAIDATSSAADTSIEVSMSDAPGSKVARERDEEMQDEPAAKRAKTETQEEDGAATATPLAGNENAATDASASANDSGADRLASIAKWKDASVLEKKITPFQRREIRKIIGRVKKTKHGGHFRDSVPKLWPALGESYLARIDKPMDLAEIDRGLRDPHPIYATFGDMKKDLGLIYENTLTFNGAQHEVTDAAFYAVRNVWQESIAIPEEEPARPKSVAKPKPPREPRVLSGPEHAVRRQSSGPASSPPPPPPPVADAKPAKPQAAEPSVDRRGSLADADRPKRTVRAPKPKDIDYTTKPSRKKLKPEMQFCDEVLAELMHPKNSTLNTWFLDAVDAEGLNIPDYYSIIKKPMDLGKVSRMVNSGEITNAKEFDKNVRLIFANCYQFNGPPDQGNPVSNLAKQLENLYVQQMKGKDAWLAKYAKANAPAASASNASDEDDDDESDDDEPAAPAVDNSKELQELKAKLEEESSKLNSMFASGTPQALIDCQRVIVDTVQQALYKVAQKQTEAKPKHQDKSAKKSSKPSKSKAAGSAPSRKSSTHAPPPKKSSSAKKPPPKRTLSAADKDQIASAINDLEYPHLDRAIDIIKRDTGQNENNEGELELDIDQLSSDALNKLWDLCKKVLPGFGKDSNATTKSPEVNRAVPAKQAPKSASKPKKNKPMSAQEQEARIAQLTAIQQLYKPGQEPADDASHAPAHNRHDESSDDSDSEEE